MKTKDGFLPAAKTLLKLLRLDELDAQCVEVRIEKGKPVEVQATLHVREHQLNKRLIDDRLTADLIEDIYATNADELLDFGFVETSVLGKPRTFVTGDGRMGVGLGSHGRPVVSLVDKPRIDENVDR